MDNPLKQLSPLVRSGLNGAVIVTSIFVCTVAALWHHSAWEMTGINPDWFLIWVVAWSVKRPAWQGIVGGVGLGLIQDGLTGHQPTHALSLGIVGLITALLQKQRYVSEDFISIALITFAMAIISATVMAGQLSLENARPLAEIWQQHRQIALGSAILSSLWAPVVYAPINLWWQWLSEAEKD